MEEQNKSTCKSCLSIKDKVLAGKYPNGKDKKWTDISGSEWSGRVCPDCHRERNRIKRKESRHAKITYRNP